MASSIAPTPGDINKRLAGLEDLGLRNFEERLLDDNFELASGLLGILNNSPLESELINMLKEFYVIHGKDEEFLNWSVENEIASTATSQELFRMQSLATKLLFGHFFDEDGMRFMNRTVSVILEKVHDMTEDGLELVPNGINVSAEEADRNLNFILSLAGKLITLMESEVSYCPKVVRRAFDVMKKAASKKFPEVEDTVVSVVFFLRFLCPTILQPESFGLADEKPPPHSFKALVICSKLLQNIANNIVKNNITSYQPHDPLVLDFIETHVETVKRFSEIFIDPDDMKLSSKRGPPSKPTKNEKEMVLDKLYQYIMVGEYRSFVDNAEEELLNKEKTVEIIRGKFNKFWNDLHKRDSNTKWKSMKSPSDKISVLCSSATISESLNIVSNRLKILQFDEWVNDVFGPTMLHSNKCSAVPGNDDELEQWTLKIKIPFPYPNRVCVCELFPTYITAKNDKSVRFAWEARNTGDKSGTMGLLDMSVEATEAADSATTFTFLFSLSTSESSFNSAVISIMGKEFGQCAERVRAIAEGKEDPEEVGGDVKRRRKSSSKRKSMKMSKKKSGSKKNFSSFFSRNSSPNMKAKKNKDVSEEQGKDNVPITGAPSGASSFTHATRNKRSSSFSPSIVPLSRTITPNSLSTSQRNSPQHSRQSSYTHDDSGRIDIRRNGSGKENRKEAGNRKSGTGFTFSDEVSLNGSSSKPHLDKYSTETSVYAAVDEGLCSSIELVSDEESRKHNDRYRKMIFQSHSHDSVLHHPPHLPSHHNSDNTSTSTEDEDVGARANITRYIRSLDESVGLLSESIVSE